MPRQDPALPYDQPAAKEAPKPQPVQDMSIPPAGRALLATIGGPAFESNGTYTQRYNQPDFSDFSKHPGTFAKIESGPMKGLSSNAAGRYQMISTTFADQAKKQGLSDFSPASQDKAAWGLARETYAAKYPGRDLASDINNPGNLPRIAQALGSKWSSLPAGLEQRGGVSKFASTFMDNLKAETAREGPPTKDTGTPMIAQGEARPMVLASNPLAMMGTMIASRGAF